MPAANLSQFPISGIMRGLNAAMSIPPSWQVAPGFGIEDDLDIEIINPRTDAGPMARWRHAAHDDTYEVFFEFTGGKPPYAALMEGPENCFLGATEANKSQVYTLIPDPDVPGMYDLRMPDDFGLIRIAPTPEQYGTRIYVSITLLDMAGRVINHVIPIDVDTAAAPKFRYLNSTSGNNANAGTKALPMQTYPYAYALSDAANFIHVFEAGTYSVYNGTPGNNCPVDGKMKSFIGRAGYVTRLDMSQGHFTGAPTDVFFDNIEFYGGRATDSNPRLCSWGSRFDRLFYQRCRAVNNPIGTQTSQDNPCVVFTPDSAGWGNQSKWFGMRDCHLDSTSKTALAVLFKIEHVIIRKCTGYSLNMDGHIALDVDPVGMFLCMKAKLTNAEVSECHASGFTNNSFINWMNQNPENCTKQRTRFCRLDYTGNTLFAPISCNAQASAVNSRSTDSRIERCSIKAGTTPVLATYGGAGGEALKVSGLLYSTTGALFSNATHAAAVDTTNVQVSASDFDSNMKMVAAIKAANLGYRGGQWATTLVS